jgi:hypothetical protein
MSDQENPMRNDNTWKGEEIHSTGKPYHEGALGQIQRDLWEMRKDYRTDMLVYEQDMINANRRIEALETYRMDSNAVEARQDDDINRLKGRVGDAHGRIERIENKNVLKRIEALENANENNSRFALDIRIQLSQLQSAVASLKLLVPPPQPQCPPEKERNPHMTIVPQDDPQGTLANRIEKLDAKIDALTSEFNNLDCVPHSAYPCKDRSATIDVTQCIYYDKGVCDYKRTHGKRPPEKEPFREQRSMEKRNEKKE